MIIQVYIVECWEYCWVDVLCYNGYWVLNIIQMQRGRKTEGRRKESTHWNIQLFYWRNWAYYHFVSVRIQTHTDAYNNIKLNDTNIKHFCINVYMQLFPYTASNKYRYFFRRRPHPLPSLWGFPFKE